jgi:hypothetical protein
MPFVAVSQCRIVNQLSRKVKGPLFEEGQCGSIAECKGGCPSWRCTSPPVERIIVVSNYVKP